MPAVATSDTVFDEPSRWRVEAARALGLHGLELAAAVAPGAGFPATMRPLLRRVSSPGCRLVVDAGAGLGGTAEWMRTIGEADVVAVEPAHGAAAGAHDLFPGVHTVRGDVAAIPVATGVADAVVTVGVVSLLADLARPLAELARVCAGDGVVAISDLVLDADLGTRRVGPNHFRSIAAILDTAAAAGLVRMDVAIGRVDTSGPWRELADAVDAEVDRRHRGDPAYRAWHADQEHLGRELSSGRLLAATITLGR